MSIKDLLIKIKLFPILSIILLGSTAIGLGEFIRLKSPQIPVKITSIALAATASAPTETAAVIASKNGTKYHYPSCPGAKQIADKNRITFASAQAAENAGYTLARNCKAPH